MTLEKDWSLEHKFEPDIKHILADQFITKDVHADLQEGTDFAVYTIQPFKAAVRLRRYTYFTNTKYRYQFTIRWSRPSGVKTEIDKIRDGQVDYFLYGFINEPETHIIQHFIGDLNVFRAVDPAPVEIHMNSPPDSELAAYELTQFPAQFIVKFQTHGDFKSNNSLQTTFWPG